MSMKNRNLQETYKPVWTFEFSRFRFDEFIKFDEFVDRLLAVQTTLVQENM